MNYYDRTKSFRKKLGFYHQYPYTFNPVHLKIHNSLPIERQYQLLKQAAAAKIFRWYQRKKGRVQKVKFIGRTHTLKRHFARRIRS